MIVYEMKLEGTQQQYEQLDAAIRTGRFVRNSIIRAWVDKQIKSRNDAYKYCKVLADNPEFPWAKKLNSMARQAHAERAWASIERFYRNCKESPLTPEPAGEKKGGLDTLSLPNIKPGHQSSTKLAVGSLVSADAI